MTLIRNAASSSGFPLFATILSRIGLALEKYFPMKWRWLKTSIS